MRLQERRRRREVLRRRRRLTFEQCELRCLLAVDLPGLVSTDVTGTEAGNGHSVSASESLSADGRYQVFASESGNLVSGARDNNSASDVFLRDLQTGQTILISATHSGDSGSGASDQPVISADGNFVAFRSRADDLESVDSNGNADIFLWRRTTGAIELISVNESGTNGGNGDSMSPSISGDGSILAFGSMATNLTAGFADANGGGVDIFVHNTVLLLTDLVSSNATETASGEASSFDPLVSEDGSTVVFTSWAGDLVAGISDTNGVEDIYAYAVASGTKEALSLEAPENVSANGQSLVDARQTTSDDGRYHVFTSFATDLDASVVDANGAADVFLFDTVTGLTTLVSATPSGHSANATSDQPVISADGSFVAFRSVATNFGTVDSNTNSDVFVWERATANIQLASPSAAGTDGGDGASSTPTISGDGQVVAFASTSSDLVAGIANANDSAGNIFLRDLGAGSTALVSSNRSGTSTGNGMSFNPLVSENGSTVIFESFAADLVPGTSDSNANSDVFAYHVATGTKEAIAVEIPGDNVSGNSDSFNQNRQTTSDDGRFHVFTSGASNLDPDATDGNAARDVYLFDSALGTKTLVSATTAGMSGNGRSDEPVISADGNFVAFRSFATDLESIDQNAASDIFLWQRATGTLSIISSNFGNTDGGSADSFRPSISGDGSVVAFLSEANDLVASVADTNGPQADVYFRDVTASTTTLVSLSADGNSTGNGLSSDVIVSEDGSTIVFESRASNLVGGVVDGNGSRDAFVYDIASGSTKVITLETNGNLSGNGTSESTQKQTSSDDGRYHVYTSEAYNLDGNAIDTGGLDVYLYDAQTQTSTLVSVIPGGAGLGGDQPVISADGNFVAFRSWSSNFGTVDQNDNDDIYLWERATGAISLVSINETGTDGGNDDSQNPAISGDGSIVTFQTSATDLVAVITDANGATEDVYVRNVAAGQTLLVSSDDTGSATGNGTSTDPIISKDGSTIVFSSTASDLVADVADANGKRDVFAYDVHTQVKDVISLEFVDNANGNDESEVGTRQTVSDDGRFQVFTSQASNLDPDIVDANGVDDVYLYDSLLGTTRLVSVTPQGFAGSSVSDQPAISGDGNFVAFRSRGNNFGPADNNGLTDIYVFDRVASTVSLVSANPAGESGDSRSFSPSISGTGSIIAFTSEASDLVANVTNPASTENIYVRDTAFSTTSVASLNQSNSATGGADSFDAVVSQDGSTVVFESLASDLVAGIVDNNNRADVFAFDVATGIRENLSFDPNVTINSSAFDPDLSDDGMIVTFASRANLTANDNNGETDVFVFDRNDQSIELVSINAAGTGSGSDDSQSPRISGDGNVVVFKSNSDDLAAPDTDSELDIFIRRLDVGTTELVSVSHDGTSGGGALGDATLSDDGRFVAFHSASTVLVTSSIIGFGLQHVFLRDTTAQQTILVDNTTDGSDVNYQSFRPVISADGSRVVFDTNAPVSLDVNFFDLNGVESDVYSHLVNAADISVGTNELVSRKSPGVRVTGDDISWLPSVSDDGRFVAFASEADFLTIFPSSGDVYVRDRVAGTTEMISINSSGTSGGNLRSRVAQISGDGSAVAFQSSATDLTAGDPSSSADIYVRNRDTGTTQLISVDSVTGNATGNATDPSISDNGRFVAFQSASSANIEGVPTTFGRRHVVLRDTVNDQSQLITVNTVGSEAGDFSFAPFVSGSGSSVVFWTEASDLIDSGFVDLNHGEDVYIHEINSSDISLGANELVSRKAAGLIVTANITSRSIEPVLNLDISDDGTAIVLQSHANGLVTKDLNFGDDIYLYDNSIEQLQLISRSTTGEAVGLSIFPRISGDGQSVVFVSESLNLTSTATSSIENIFVFDRTSGNVELVTINDAGDRGGNDVSDFPSISDDGRYIAFVSEATDLLDGSISMNSRDSVFLHDRTLGQTTLASVDVSGTVDANQRAFSPWINGDGSSITFTSEATNLVGADFIDINGSSSDDVFLYQFGPGDVTSGTNQIVSGRPIGTIFTADTGSTDPDVSDDGQVVVFSSQAELLTFDASVSTNRDIFVRNRANQTTELISVSRFGGRGANRSSETARISGDGNSVLFDSRASDLTINSVSTSIIDLFVHDRAAGMTELVTVDTAGGGANGNSLNFSISDDGRFIAFQGNASDLVAAGLTSGFRPNVFLRDTLLNQTSLVTINSDGTNEANFFSLDPGINGDGSRVLFISLASDLIGDGFVDVNGFNADVYSHLVNPADISQGKNQLVSRQAPGVLTTGNGQSIDPDVSDDGHAVTFVSLATGLVPSDTNANFDVYVRDRSSDTTELISINTAGTGPADGNSAGPAISGDGNTIVFQSGASDLSSVDSGFVQDVFAFDRDTGIIQLISVHRDGTDGGDQASSAATVSDDGRHVAFISEASTLVAPGTVTAGRANVYYRDRQEARTELVSQNAAGSANGNGDSSVAAISDNGVTIAFQSDATDLVTQLDNNGGSDVFFANNNIITVQQIIYFNRDAADEQNSTSDGTGQRSLIRQFEITFSGPVAIPVGPISDDSFTVESILTATAGTRVGLEVISSDLVAGRQVVTLGFTGSELIEDVSQNQPGTRPMLEDGRYRLTIDGNQLGIDADLSDPSVVANNEFFRLYGDTDGDGDVDAVDTFRLRQHWLSGNHAALFDFDDDDDGPTDVDDLLAYLFRFGMTI